MDRVGDTRRLLADRGDAGRRLDLVVRRHLADLSAATRTRVQGWIEAGAVTVNGRSIRRAAARVSAGDEVAVKLPPDAGGAFRSMAAEDRALDVLYEDDHFLAINKPAGVVVHPTYRHYEGTVMNALLWHARNGDRSARPSVVGRLDKLTSGIVIAAKGPRAHAALQRALSSDRSEKQYLALVYGRPPARGEIDLRLRRDARDRRRVVASTTAGVPSLTRFERLGAAPTADRGLALLRCQLLTGRMHQIRVHLAARGWPIVGDAKYGEPRWRDIADGPLRIELSAFSRQALHAWRLVLANPFTHRRLTIEAPIPADFERLLNASGLVECAR